MILIKGLEQLGHLPPKDAAAILNWCHDHMRRIQESNMIFDPMDLRTPKRFKPATDEREFQFRSTVDPVHRKERRDTARSRILGEVSAELDTFLDKHFGRNKD